MAKFGGVGTAERLTCSPTKQTPSLSFATGGQRYRGAAHGKRMSVLFGLPFCFLSMIVFNNWAAGLPQMKASLFVLSAAEERTFCADKPVPVRCITFRFEFLSRVAQLVCFAILLNTLIIPASMKP